MRRLYVFKRLIPIDGWKAAFKYLIGCRVLAQWEIDLILKYR